MRPGRPVAGASEIGPPFQPQGGEVHHDAATGVVFVDVFAWGPTPGSALEDAQKRGDTSADIAGRIADVVAEATAVGRIPEGALSVEHNGRADQDGGMARIIVRQPTHVDVATDDGKIATAIVIIDGILKPVGDGGAIIDRPRPGGGRDFWGVILEKGDWSKGGTVPPAPGGRATNRAKVERGGKPGSPFPSDDIRRAPFKGVLDSGWRPAPAPIRRFGAPGTGIRRQQHGLVRHNPIPITPARAAVVVRNLNQLGLCFLGVTGPMASGVMVTCIDATPGHLIAEQSGAVLNPDIARRYRSGTSHPAEDQYHRSLRSIHGLV